MSTVPMTASPVRVIVRDGAPTKVVEGLKKLSMRPITLSDWTFEVSGDCGVVRIDVQAHTQDTDTGLESVVHSSCSLTSDMLERYPRSIGEIVREMALRRLVLHELDEALYGQDGPVTPPHPRQTVASGVA